MWSCSPPQQEGWRTKRGQTATQSKHAHSAWPCAKPWDSAVSKTDLILSSRSSDLCLISAGGSGLSGTKRPRGHTAGGMDVFGFCLPSTFLLFCFGFFFFFFLHTDLMPLQWLSHFHSTAISWFIHVLVNKRGQNDDNSQTPSKGGRRKNYALLKA